MKSRYILLSILMALLLLASACTIQKSIEKENAIEVQTITVNFVFDANEQNYHKEISVQSVKGVNAFELLSKNADIEFTQYSIGKFITGINGIKPKENEYWALYINGSYSDKGIEGITLNDDTKIMFRIEKFS